MGVLVGIVVVGVTDGLKVGENVVGIWLGVADGEEVVGDRVGETVGTDEVGILVGVRVGTAVGMNVVQHLGVAVILIHVIQFDSVSGMETVILDDPETVGPVVAGVIHVAEV